MVEAILACKVNYLALIDITKLGSYAFGDILTAGAIGAFAGIENIIIISICAIILGKLIIYFGARFDGLFDKSSIKFFHFAFVPVLFLITAGYFIFHQNLKFLF